jgi:hypothetical protein
VPTTKSEKLLLEEAGLGEKVVTIPDVDCTPEAFHQLLRGTFPKLQSGGGHELLRCKPQSRDLVLVGPKAANNARLLKRQVGNGKVYIRPIQRDLGLEAEDSCEAEGVSTCLAT